MAAWGRGSISCRHPPEEPPQACKSNANLLSWTFLGRTYCISQAGLPLHAQCVHKIAAVLPHCDTSTQNTVIREVKPETVGFFKPIVRQMRFDRTCAIFAGLFKPTVCQMCVDRTSAIFCMPIGCRKVVSPTSCLEMMLLDAGLGKVQ